MLLTLIVDAKVNATIIISVYDGGKAGGGGRFCFHPANLSLVKAFVFGVAKFLDGVVGVKVVDAELSVYTVSPRAKSVWPYHLHLPLFRRGR